MKPILNAAAYKFAPLTDLMSRRDRLRELCERLQLRGSILISPEGINLFVAGEADPVESLLTELRSWPGLADLTPKLSGTETQPFRRMIVRVKKEIIAFGVKGIDPARYTSPKLPATELKRWLDEKRPVTLLDTRNRYEVKLGTFRNALSIDIDHFRDFPAAVEKLPTELKDQPIVMFCTGGIRCEKAGPFMEREGFQQIYQLDGGILKYFEECGDAHYEGECFVFDQRTGLDAGLHPTSSTQCFNCRLPLTEEDQRHEHHVPGASCRYCYRSPAEKMAAVIAKRHARVQEIIHPLPGSQPHDHFRPISIPHDCDGRPLIEALCRVVAHVPAQMWRERCALNLVLDAEDRPCAPDHIVRSGERYRHKFPAVIEPDVNMNVEILYEDEALFVINKPAPLPMHAGGRFYRNTLKYVLDELYRPEKPRPSHRLDANTTGALVVARTQFIAKKIQTQFARGEVEKRYLVRVHGHPPEDTFTCDAPISVDAGKLGSRFIDHEEGLSARTDFKVIERHADGTASVEARPLTGRTNQIRVHLWHLGFPVCGDPAYVRGNTLGESQTLDIGDPPLCLHAWQISFEHPLHRQTMTFTAPPPEWIAVHPSHPSLLNSATT